MGAVIERLLYGAAVVLVLAGATLSAGLPMVFALALVVFAWVR